MKLAAVHAIAELAKEPVPDVVNAAYKLKRTTFGRDYILPKALDPTVVDTSIGCCCQGSYRVGCLTQNNHRLGRLCQPFA